ncbi:MAG: rod shape-determining protein MreC [Bacillota bacterium]|nr:rod shape-determining protein MreC [Bacillota bacterium]
MPKILKNSLIALAVLILLSLMLVSFLGRNGITWVEDKLGGITMTIGKAFSAIGSFVDEKVEPFFNVLSYKQQNENLTKQNQALREELISVTLTRKDKEELERLERALHITRGIDDKRKIGANVIGKDPGNWFNIFTVDVGSKQGVTKNSTVINGKGLIGIVYEVGENWSKVMSIIDQKNSVAFEMIKSDHDFDGIISGSKSFELICEFYDPEAKYEIGDYLMTSGVGIYPKGIMIGRIVKSLDNPNELYKKALVEPVADFRKIKKVLIIKYEEVK